ncbi:MAG: nuclear transport factor 2 family protein [Candidatus Sungiibacteriota bacterium]
MDVFGRKIAKDYVSFREKPGTALEESVAEFLTAYLNDCNSRRMEKVAGYFTDDAIIDAKALGSTVTKETYIKVMSAAIKDLFLFTLDQVAITAENSDATAVRVSGVLTISLGNRLPEQEFCVLHLKKSGTGWKINRTVLESISKTKFT